MMNRIAPLSLLLVSAFGPSVFAQPAQATTSGSLDRAAIMTVINGESARADLRACGEGVEARVVLAVGIDPSGSVRSVDVEGGTETVQECLRERLVAWRFPAASGPTTVRYPVVYAANAGAGAAGAETGAGAPARPVPTSRETQCTDGNDDDGDGMVDCSDADCFDVLECNVTGEERNAERCSDWVDNDGDGAVDCEDPDCSGPGIDLCHGSAQQHTRTLPDDHAEDLPELTGDMAAEDLIGRGGDADGERNDFMCSDGVDNDGDGRTDCMDFGCRFDPQVTVCTASPGYRFGVVAGVGLTYDLEADTDLQTAADVNFTRLQIRALGPIPYINNSFFLISARLERSPRVTFAHFQVPLGSRGHFLAINSGSGSLSTGLIISTAKQPLLDPPFYLFNAFEQGNSASIEVGGPLTQSNALNFRVFAAGGAGRSNGNVGGRFFPAENQNFTYTAGAQFGINFIGHFSRFDSPLLYDRVPLGLGMLIGGKWDQRATERYPAANALLVFKYGPFLIRAENYFKYSLDFGGSLQNAFNVQATLLLWPKHLVLAADFGMYTAEDYTDLPGDDALGPERLFRDEFQARVALHWWWYRNIGLLTLLYTERHLEEDENPATQDTERVIRLEAQFRF